jgi:hypothetical protein
MATPLIHANAARPGGSNAITQIANFQGFINWMTATLAEYNSDQDSAGVYTTVNADQGFTLASTSGDPGTTIHDALAGALATIAGDAHLQLLLTEVKQL